MLGDGTSELRMLSAAAAFLYQSSERSFTLFFGLLMLGFVSSVFIFKWKVPAEFFLPLDIAVVVAGFVLVAQSWFADKREHRFSVTALAAVAAPFTIAVALGLLGLFVPNHIEAASITLVGFSLASVVAAREIRASASEKARCYIGSAANLMSDGAQGYYLP